MAYNVAANMQFGRPVSAFIDARDNVQRNALAERNTAAAEGTLAFNQNRQSALDKLTADKLEKEAADADAQKLHTAMQYLNSVASNPQAFQSTAQRMLQHPDIGRILQGSGVTIEDITPQNVQELLAASGAASGQGPAPAPKQYITESGPRGALIQVDPDTGERKQIVGPDNTESRPPAAGAYRALTAEEVARVGLPAGTSAQIGPDGKIDVLSKRDNTGVLSQKDATTAKMKINTVALARSQLQKIKEAFEKGSKGLNAFGGAQGWLPTQAGKLFDARVDQMRSTLTALTRVPGVGAMSDYETKLDQAKFPSRTAYESTTADVLQNLDDQLALIESGYKGLLSGAQSPAEPPGGGKPTVSNW